MITANGEVRTSEQVYVHDLELFVTVQIFDDTLESKATSDQEWEIILCNLEKLCACLLSQDCLQVRAQVRLPHRYRRTRLVVSLQVQHYNEVTTPTLKRGDPTKIKNKK